MYNIYGDKKNVSRSPEVITSVRFAFQLVHEPGGQPPPRGVFGPCFLGWPQGPKHISRCLPAESQNFFGPRVENKYFIY